MVKVVEPRLSVPALRSSAPLLGLLLVSCGSPTTTPSTPSATPAAERVASGQVPAHTSRLLAAGVDIADVIDALFLGSGPDVAPNAQTACPIQRVWTAFPRGTVVRVRVSSTVSPEARAAMQQALAQVTTATRGVVRTAIEETPELDPVPGTDEVTVSAVPDPRAVGCRAASGCVRDGFRGRGILQFIRVVEALTQGAGDYVRDVVGRGVLGMCQVNGRRVAPAGGSLMSVEPGTSRALGGLTPLDLEATQAVYGSTLEPGAPRDDFGRAGPNQPDARN